MNINQWLSRPRLWSSRIKKLFFTSLSYSPLDAFSSPSRLKPGSGSGLMTSPDRPIMTPIFNITYDTACLIMTTRWATRSAGRTGRRSLCGHNKKRSFFTCLGKTRRRTKKFRTPRLLKK